MLVASEHGWQLVDSQLTHYTQTSRPTKTSGSIHITDSSTLFLVLSGMSASKNPFLIQDTAASRGYGCASPSAAPLFLIHDASGNIVSYLKLGSLGGARRVYGISDPHFGHEGGAWLSVNEMARHYIKLVKKVTLRGNILLGGEPCTALLALDSSALPMFSIFPPPPPCCRITESVSIRQHGHDLTGDQGGRLGASSPSRWLTCSPQRAEASCAQAWS